MSIDYSAQEQRESVGGRQTKGDHLAVKTVMCMGIVFCTALLYLAALNRIVEREGLSDSATTSLALVPLLGIALCSVTGSTVAVVFRVPWLCYSAVPAAAVVGVMQFAPFSAVDTLRLVLGSGGLRAHWMVPLLVLLALTLSSSIGLASTANAAARVAAAFSVIATCWLLALLQGYVISQEVASNRDWLERVRDASISVGPAPIAGKDEQ